MCSIGMVRARSCALTAVSLVLGGWLARPPNTVRQQLRASVDEREAKRGAQRQALAVRTCLRPLLAWVLAGYPGAHLALALDATTLGDRFVALAVSVVERGGAILVAWTVLRAASAHAWRSEWLLGRALPRSWTVVVLADRGLYARWLYRHITRLGGHPFRRVTVGGTFRPAGHAAYQSLRRFTPTLGSAWAGRGTACNGRQRALACTLLARWEAGDRDPWLIRTDRPPAAATAAWYGRRAWIEPGFKRTKRAGWPWQRTRITAPARAERLWRTVAVATLWLVRVGDLRPVPWPLRPPLAYHQLAQIA